MLFWCRYAETVLFVHGTSFPVRPTMLFSKRCYDFYKQLLQCSPQIVSLVCQIPIPLTIRFRKWNVPPHRTTDVQSVFPGCWEVAALVKAEPTMPKSHSLLKHGYLVPSHQRKPVFIEVADPVWIIILAVLVQRGHVSIPSNAWLF